MNTQNKTEDTQKGENESFSTSEMWWIKQALSSASFFHKKHKGLVKRFRNLAEKFERIHGGCMEETK